jgi:excisionase family DNA binding protein
LLRASACESARMDTTEIPKFLVSKREAAIALGISVRTIDNLLACKELLARKVGRRTLIPVTELERFARRDHQTKAVPREVQS